MKNKLSRKDKLAFLFGVGSFTQIRIIGAMGITELVCICLLPIVLYRIWPILINTKALTIIKMLVFWFLSAVITDVYRATSLNDAMRGIVALPMLASSLVVTFALLWDDLYRTRWVLLGFVVSLIISMYIFHPASLISRASQVRYRTVAEVMDFRNYYAIIVLSIMNAVAVFLYKKTPSFVIIIQILVSALSLIYGSRGLFAIIFVSSIGVMLYTRNYSTFRLVQKNVVITLIIGFFALAIAFEIYSNTVKAGWMGDDQLKKYENQSDSDIGLIAGRAHFITAIIAIGDSPVIGHGSWPNDKNRYGLKMYDFIGDTDSRKIYLNICRSGYIVIPTHSHLWQAWVWHGIFGGIFWIYILYLLIQFLRQAIHINSMMIVYNLNIVIAAIWSILFSPFGNRIQWAILFTIVALTFREIERRKRDDYLVKKCNERHLWDGKWKVGKE